MAEVRVAKRFYSHRLELVAQLEQTGPTHYLKVKPSLRGRADDTVDQKPATFEQCGAAPAWEGETVEVPAASMGNPRVVPLSLSYHCLGCLRAARSWSARRGLAVLAPSLCVFWGVIEAATGDLGCVDLSFATRTLRSFETLSSAACLLALNSLPRALSVHVSPLHVSTACAAPSRCTSLSLRVSAAHSPHSAPHSHSCESPPRLPVPQYRSLYSTACGSPLQEHLPRTPEKRSRAPSRARRRRASSAATATCRPTRTSRVTCTAR